MKTLITGGSGFLGRHLIHLLQKKGSKQIRTLNRQVVNDLEEKGVECFYGDIVDPQVVDRAVNGCEVVFHVAAKAGIWGSYKDYFSINVLGTHNLLRSCQKYNVPYFVYTSTPSVVFNGEALSNVNETLPYGGKWLCSYAKTKAMAEHEVLLANGKNGLKTIALRPHLIWGPGDNHLIPTLLHSARKGKLFQVGDGDNWVDISYVENVAWAHVLALDALKNGKTEGKAYFISQNDPVKLWDWINALLGRLNLPLARKRVPYKMAYSLGWAFELLYGLAHIKQQPPMTRFLAIELAKDHYFDISAAKMDLTYLPKISNEEGMERLIRWLQC